MKVDGKLNLDWSLHLVLSVLQDFSHQFRQREDVVLQDTREGDDLAVPALIESIVDALVNGVVSAAYPLKRAVLLGLSNGYLDKVEAIVCAYLASFC